MENLKQIAVCHNPFMAEVIKGELADNDIACMVVDQTITGVNGGYGALPGFAIKVYEKDEARARTIAERAMARE